VSAFVGKRTIHGWAVSKVDPEAHLKISVNFNGQDLPCKISWYRRVDLTEHPGNHAGFTLGFQNDLDLRGWLSGGGEICAVDREARSRLPISGPGWDSLVKNFLVDYSTLRGKGFLSALISEMSRSPELSTLQQGALSNAATVLLDNKSTATSSLATQVYVPAGLQSLDGVAILGHDGHAFLIGGSNNVSRQYSDDSDNPEVKETSARWLAILTKRLEYCISLDANFTQILIPEKQTVIPHLFPSRISVPSVALRILEDIIDSDVSLRKVYLSGWRTFNKSEESHKLYRKIDTHFSELGSFEIFNAFLAHIGEHSLDRIGVQATDKYRPGDLSERFFGTPLLNEVVLTSNVDPRLHDHDLTLVSELIPETGGHIGRRYIWRNSSSPSEKRVVAFGNSFFERGGGPSQLSWWFARYFREFHFIWSPDFDPDYIRKVRPELVVCQTIERFLSRPPRV
jgi:hypothetical protein